MPENSGNLIFCNTCRKIQEGIYFKQQVSRNPLKMAFRLARSSPLGLFIDRSKTSSIKFKLICGYCSSDDIRRDIENIEETI
jgi:hypothetical protein